MELSDEGEEYMFGIGLVLGLHVKARYLTPRLVRYLRLLP